ncbi:dynamin family protein [Deltaproteobacteria bacterium TL4]
MNTWLEKEILGVDTLPETTIATELRYGMKEKLILHYLNEKVEERELGDLKTLSKNTKDILFAELYLNNIKLKHRPSLVLVDMPGIGSNYENHTKALVNYVQRGHYYVLVLDVQNYSDADVLNFIRELTSYKQNFSAIITKVARKSKDQLAGIKQIVQERCLQLTKNQVEVGLVECDTPDIRDFEVHLGVIFSKEESIFQTQFAHPMEELFQGLQQYFNRLLAGDNLSGREVDEKIAECSKNQKKLERDLHEMLETLNYQLQEVATERVVNEVQNALNANLSALVSASESGSTTLNKTLTNILRLLILKSVQREASSEIEKISGQLESLLQNAFPDFHFNLTPSYEIGKNGAIAGGLTGAAAGSAWLLGSAVLVPIAGITLPVLGLIAAITGYGIRAQKKALEAQVRDEIIPHAVAQSRTAIRECMTQIQKDIASKITKELQQKKAEYEKALETLKSQKIESQQTYNQNKVKWEAALVQLSGFAEQIRL